MSAHVPANVEAEMALLGAMLRDPLAIDEARERLTAEDFFRSEHIEAAGILFRLRDQGLPTDAQALATELEGRGRDLSSGSPYDPVQYMERAVVWEDARYYAKIVRGKAIMRAILAVSEEAARLGRRTDLTADAAAERLAELALAVGQRTASGRARPASEGVNGTLDRFERRRHGERLSGKRFRA
jgi:replicative DNA helicase